MTNSKYSTFSGIALGVSMVVGTGLLSLTGMALTEGGPTGSLLGWMVAALAISPFLVIFAGMSHVFPTAAGLAECVAQAFGDWAGRGMAALLLMNILFVLPAVALIGGEYLQQLLFFPAGSATVIAVGILALATLLNLIGNRYSCFLSKVSLVILFGLLGILLVAYPHFVVEGFHALNPEDLSVTFESHRLWKVTTLVIFAYLGWENLSFAAVDFEHPEKTLKRSYAGSFLLVLILYFTLALLVTGAAHHGSVGAGPAGLTVLFQSLPGGRMLLLAIGIVSLANATSWIYGASRAISAASHKGYLPHWCGRTSVHGVPQRALLAGFVITSAATVLAQHCGGGCSTLFLLVTQGFLVVYFLCVLAYWRISHGVASGCVTVASLLSFTFLISGFHWWMSGPVLVFTLSAVRGIDVWQRIPRFVHHPKRWAH